MEYFEVVYDEKAVGTAAVDQEGLYCCIDCRCKQMELGLVRLWVIGSIGEADLGIMVPEAGQLRIRTRIPVKRIGNGKLRFEVRCAKEEKEDWVEVRPDEPFAYLSRLQSAFLKKKNGELGIVFSHKESSNPTGQ